ncbi:MAG: Ig-like domain-containing protein [Deltaproteobacteria bacterium]|nr:Ig-like domain-containing protein [Deltaproteobacteria bacterium]
MFSSLRQIKTIAGRWLLVGLLFFSFGLWFLPFGFWGCGGSTEDSEDGSTSPEKDATAPTLSTLKDSSGNTLASTGSTVRVSSSFLFTFTEAMDTTSLSTNTVTLSCNGTAVTGKVAASTDSDGIADNEFTFDPDANISQRRSCTLTVVGGSDGVKDATGNPLAENLAYTMTSGCGSSDDFSNAETLANCFVFSNSSNQKNAAGGSSGAAITLASERVKLDHSTDFISVENGFNTVPSLAKEVSGDFSAEITFTSMFLEATTTIVGIGVAPTMGEGTSNLLLCGQVATGCSTTTYTSGTLAAQGGSSCALTEVAMAGSINLTVSTSITLRVVRSGTTFSCFRKAEGQSSFTQIGNNITQPNLSGNLFLAIYGASYGMGGTTEFTADNLTFNSGSAVEQD